MDREIVEEIIFGMVDIINENYRLKRELKEAKEYERKYHELLDQSVANAAAGQKAIFEAILAGAFTSGKSE